ncbi:hypothetical protein BC830DRAFT_535866 [Chytriomyces sp. MP71]|nr:hypothetical protein BC830DRAFT_535866 [Chytriomyces sp. MP71]
MSSNRAVATSSCGPTDPTVGSLTRQSDSDKQEEGGGDTEDPATNAANDPPRRTSAIISQMVAETLLSLRSPTQSPTHERDLFAASVLEQLGSSDYEDEDDEEPSDGRVFTGAEDLDAHLEILFETVQRGAGATGGHVDSLSLVAAAMELDAKWIGAGSLMHHAGSGGFKRNGYTFGVSQDALLLKQENDTHFPDAAGRDDVESLDWSEVVKYVEGDESETESYVQPTSRTRTPSNGSRKRKYDMRLERPFVCVIDTCRKSYTKKRGLIIHGKMAHPDPASLERLKKVLPKPAAQSKALSGVIYDEEDEDDFGEKEDDESDTDSFMMRGKRSRSHEPGSVKGSPISRASSLPKSSTLLKGSSLSLKGAPSINVSTPDGTTDVNQSPSMTKKKRIRRLSASDFTSDSGGEGMLSAQMAEDLAARINHLNEQRPFLCTHKGCTKRYKNSNGLKYHLGACRLFILDTQYHPFRKAPCFHLFR